MPALPRALRAVLVLLAGALVVGLAGVGTAAADPQPARTFSTAPDPLARYVGQVSCDPTTKPGTRALADLVLATYGAGRSSGITRACSVGGTSEHKEGRAWDWAMNAADPQQKAVADRFVAWLTGPDAQGVAAGNARRLGVMYVIWDRRAWEAYRADETPGSGWRSYTGASPHTDHVHVSLSWDGAFQRTSWWTGTAITSQDLGPCGVYAGEPAPPYSGPRYAACPPLQNRSADWLIKEGPAGPGAFTTRFAYGNIGDTALSCDTDGDGKDGVVIYRAGTWFLNGAARPGAPTATVAYGAAGMRPVCGDWDGDGKDGIGVYDGSSWSLRNTATPGAPDAFFQYGWPTAKVVVGDWDGDRKETVGVYDGSTWWLRNSNGPGAPDLLVGYGWPSARLVVGDWDGDGRDGIGVYDGARWWLRQTASAGAPDLLFEYGWSGVAPVPGKWSAGRDGVAVVAGAL